MINYSVQSRGQLFVKGYAFLSFAKKVSENSGKNITKNLSGKYTQKPLGHAKQSATDTLETISKRVLQKKPAEATADFMGNKIANEITKISKNSPQNNSETVKNEHDKEIPKKDIVSRRKKENY